MSVVKVRNMAYGDRIAAVSIDSMEETYLDGDTVALADRYLSDGYGNVVLSITQHGVERMYIVQSIDLDYIYPH